jgi:hypothetical protein
MVYIDMTGEQIKNVLEDAVDYYLDANGSSGAYPKASGLRFDVNEGLPKGKRISNLEIPGRRPRSWESFEMSATYTVGTSDYLAGSNDGYYEFGNIADEFIEYTDVEQTQSVIDHAIYVDSLQVTIISVTADQESTQNWSNTAPPTDHPSETPTVQQSAAPSSPPSEVPTDHPSEMPTVRQSAAPSSPPSHDLCGADNPDFRANGKDGKDCDWIAEKPQTRCIKDEAALHKCPSVCSPVCTGICQIDLDYRNKNKSKRDCDWVAKKPNSRCGLTNNEPFFKCSGVCNPFCNTN